MRFAPFGLLVLLITAPVFARQTPPATLEIDGAFLAHVKEQHDPAILKAVCVEADHAMSQGPFSVMQKTETPPSGSKHDYMSLAPYWWPNPRTAFAATAREIPKRAPSPTTRISSSSRMLFTRWRSAISSPGKKRMPRAPFCFCGHGFLIQPPA